MRYIFEDISYLSSGEAPRPTKVVLDLTDIVLVYCCSYEWGDRAVIRAKGICFVAQETIYKVTKLLDDSDRGGSYLG